MMTCIYQVWAAKKGSQNVRLALEPIEQMEWMTEYIAIEKDEVLAKKVIRSIQDKISWEAYRQVYLAAMSEDPERLDVIYRFLRIGFAAGASVTKRLHEEPVMRLFKLSRRVSNEMHYFKEFLRFTKMKGEIYVAHMEPINNVVALTAQHFADRMPSEHWMIVDDIRNIGVIHPKDQSFYVTQLTSREKETLKKTERLEDEYSMLWREFFQAIAIEKRKNPECQRNLFPLRYRKHVLEFQ